MGTIKKYKPKNKNVRLLQSYLKNSKTKARTQSNGK
jgi:hypothetical protein